MKPSLAIISTVNTSEAELEVFIAYHLRSPEITMIVFLDKPEHMTYASVAKYEGRVSFVPCTQEHWYNELGRQPANMPEKQHTNIRAGAKLAREMGLNWAISIDNDELIYPLEGIGELLDKLKSKGTDALKLRPMEAVHTIETAFDVVPFQTEFFRVLHETNKQYLRKVQMLPRGLRSRLLQHLTMTRRGFFGHVLGKSIFSLHAPITEYKQHNQYSSVRELKKNESKCYHILHFDALNYQHWREKWYRRTLGATRATAISRERARLTSLTKAALFFGWIRADKFLFRWLYVFRGRDMKVLVNRGLVKMIKHGG